VGHCFVGVVKLAFIYFGQIPGVLLVSEPFLNSKTMSNKSTNLPDAVKANLKKFFTAFDKDGNGKIDPGELKSALEATGFHFAPQVINRMIKLVNVRPPFGSIDFEEFCNLSAYLDATRKSFDSADTNKNGKIDMKELGEALLDTGFSITSTQLKKLLKLVDMDGNGDIQFEEFVSLSFYLKLISDLFEKNKSGNATSLNEDLSRLGIKLPTSQLSKDHSLDDFLDAIYKAERAKW